MKHIFLFILLNISCATFGQTTKIIRKVVPIQEKLVFQLDGGAATFINGTSRVYLEFELPENTIEWYYVFSSQSDAERTAYARNNINLVAQLTHFIDPTGFSSIGVASLLAPSGSEQCNIYLLPSREDAHKFYTKTDQSIFDESWHYYGGNSILAATDGKKKITDLTTKKCYIGIQNPSINSTINVVIEVAAIVEEEVTDLSEWSVERKESIYDYYKELLISSAIKESAADEIATCMLNQLVGSYSPDDFSNLSETEIKKIYVALAEDCLTTFQGGAKTDEQKKGATVGSMGWSAYENGDIEKAITLSKKALTYDNSLGWVHGNLGLFYIIQGDELTSLDYYLDAIQFVKKDQLNAKRTFEELIKDIENAKLKYPEMKGYQEILEQLSKEMNGL